MRYRLRTLFLLNAVVAAYFGSYLAVMEPTIYVNEMHLGMVTSGYRAPDYRFGEPVARVVFWPAAQLDQALRPDYWGPYRD